MDVQQAFQVVVVVAIGLADAVAHGFEGREVDDARDARVAGEERLGGGVVGKFHLMEGHLLAGNARDAIQAFGGAVGQVVGGDGAISAGPKHFERRDGADVTGATGDENLRHGSGKCLREEEEFAYQLP